MKLISLYYTGVTGIMSHQPCVKIVISFISGLSAANCSDMSWSLSLAYIALATFHNQCHPHSWPPYMGDNIHRGAGVPCGAIASHGCHICKSTLRGANPGGRFVA